ncbi:MAG: SRPBCC family protein [Actinomycetota bacterium]
MRVEADWHLPAPLDEAWRALLRWEDQARWIRDAVSVRVLSPHREGLGVRIAVKSRVYNVPLFTEVLEVTRWEPPHVLEMTHRSFIRGVGTWALEPEGTGARLRWSEDLALPIPVLGELALLVYRPFLRRLMRGALRDLSAHLRSA